MPIKIKWLGSVSFSEQLTARPGGVIGAARSTRGNRLPRGTASPGGGAVQRGHQQRPHRVGRNKRKMELLEQAITNISPSQPHRLVLAPGV